MTMRVYVIEGTQVAACTDEPAPAPKAALVIRSVEDLAGSDLSPQRLVALWNGLPGATPVKKFKDRKTAVRRLWAAFQTLPLAASARRSAAKPRERTRREDSKQARVIALLRRPKGATVDDLVAATGWQPHTVRGVLSGALKKRLGLKIRSEKTGASPRTYRIA
jgi:hypothetical protein